MGLYLCVFENEEEIDGIDVGRYADFDSLRTYISRELEGGRTGSRFPIFIRHSDCDGEWLPSELDELHRELTEIASELIARSAVPFASDWQIAVAKSIGLVPRNALESFIDVDGEFLIDRLRSLVKCAQKRGVSILFQ